MIGVLVILPLISALTLQKNLDQRDLTPEVAPIPETNLDTLLSTSMEARFPQTPSEEVRRTYTNIIQRCIPDYDTVYIGIYLSDNEHALKVEHIQTSAAGHVEHMANALQGVVEMSTATPGFQLLGVDLGGPKQMLNDLWDYPAMQKAMPADTKNYVHHSGKKHRFTAMNHHRDGATALSLVMLDSAIQLPSGLTPAILQIMNQFILRAEETPTQATFDVLYRSEDQSLALREIYQNGQAAVEFKVLTEDLWKMLIENSGTLVKQDISGPPQEIETIRGSQDTWEEQVHFYKQLDGFQRVQVRAS